MHIPSNVTPEEYFRHYCQDEHAKKFFTDSLDELTSKEADSNSRDKQEELLREQIFFAHELISAVEEQLNRTTSLKEYKKTFARILADSLFER